MSARTFSRQQKNILYKLSNGKCSICGCELPDTWHADHILPHVAGGKTSLGNGQALCPQCNLKKGSRMPADTIEYRPMQKSFIEATKNNVANGRNVLVANVAPGSGKTLAAQAAANELYRSRLIDTVIVLTPRKTLCQQFELDWKRDKDLFAEPKMGKIVHRPNVRPLLREDQFGYATTYQSLVSEPDIHLEFALKHRGRFALILDEAQMLGADESSGLGTQSAKWTERIGEFARFIFVMSGTPYRADGKPLVFATYTDPDQYGVRYLEADVTATYREGVTERYLREFEYHLFDGQALYEYLSGGVDILTMSEMNSGLSKVLCNKGYWGHLVDLTVDAVKEKKSIHRSMCGLIGAIDQDHARDIIAYIESKHKGVSAILAVSDEAAALDNLRQFKTGKYDILVTVAMAHVGYDHKPICVVAALNSFREHGWMDQFFARGMRVMPDVPYELQTLLCIVPDDPRMVEYVEQKRQESVQGVKERQTREGNRANFVEPEPGITSWATPTGARAKGLDPLLDVEPEDYEIANEHRRKYNLGSVNITGLWHLIKDLSITQSQSTAPRAADVPVSRLTTEKEWEQLLRAQIQKVSTSCDKLLGQEYGYTNKYMKKLWKKGMPECGVTELNERLSWLRNTWKPQCEAARK